MRKLLSVLALIVSFGLVVLQAQHQAVGSNAIEVTCHQAHTALFLGEPQITHYMCRYTAVGQDPIEFNCGKPVATAANVCRFVHPPAVKNSVNIEWRWQYAAANEKGVSAFNSASAPFGEKGIPAAPSGIGLARP